MPSSRIGGLLRRRRKKQHLQGKFAHTDAIYVLRNKDRETSLNLLIIFLRD